MITHIHCVSWAGFTTSASMPFYILKRIGTKVSVVLSARMLSKKESDLPKIQPTENFINEITALAKQKLEIEFR